MAQISFVIFCLVAGHLVSGKNLPSGEDIKVGERDYDKYPDIPYRGDLYQGDIKLKDPEDGGALKPDQLNAVWNKNLLWPGNIVYYHIRTEEFSSQEVSNIQAGINLLQSTLSIGGNTCILFRERTNEPNYVDVRRLDGCWSYVGRITGRQEMSFGTGCFRLGTVQHEFLHALGFYHEQSREDRDSYVSIIWDNIYPEYHYAFDKYQDGVTIDHLGFPYDYNSVMHYHAYAFAINPSLPTIIPTDSNADISHKDYLSTIDTQMTQVLYGCMRAKDSTYFKHLVDAGY